jgi:hypothetical protein
MRILMPVIGLSLIIHSQRFYTTSKSVAFDVIIEA